MEDYSSIANQYGINDNISAIEERGDGYYITGDDCNYYVPKNCSSTTNGIIFYHGAGGWQHDTNRMVDSINGNIDSVIVFPKSNYGFNATRLDDENARLNSNIENIMNHVGADTGNVSTVTFSAGEVGGVQGIAYNIEQHPEVKGQVCVLVDPKADQTGHGGERLMYNDNSYMKNSQEDTIRLLAENEATLIVYEQEASLADGGTLANYERFARAGVNVIMIGGPSEHVAEFQNALDKDMLSYMSGDYSKLGSLDGSKMIKYDHETGTWVEASTDDIIEAYGNQGTIRPKKYNPADPYYSNANFDDFTGRISSLTNLSLLTSSGIDTSNMVKSDLDYVISNMNDIRGFISRTSSLNNCNNFDSSSTTKIPTAIKDYIYRYFNTTVELLEKIVKETENAVTIGTSVNLTDEELGLAVEEISDATITDDGIITPVNDDNDSSGTIAPVPSSEPINESYSGGTISPVPPSNKVSNDNGSVGVITPVTEPISQSANDNVITTSETPIYSQSNDFPEYNDIYTDDNKLVYMCEDGSKMIIYHENGQVTGIEYYYDMGTEENAIASIDSINSRYSNIETNYQEMQNGRYIKVVLDNNYVNRYTLDDITNQYGHLEVVRRG